MNKNHKPVTVALDTLGCKLNQAETESLARQFSAAGYTVVPPDSKADIYVLNTCTVTHIADRKARHRLRMARRRNPDALLVATGCYAERAPAEIAQLDGIGLVLGNNNKGRLLEMLQETGYSNPATAIDEPIAPDRPGFRTRAFIKIQDGCYNFCTYCIVPLMRSHESSVPAGQVVSEIEQRLAEGYREVVLTGVKVGTYDDNGTNLRQLLGRILQETAVPRVRLSSLQPPEISPELIGLWREERLCRHFHLSLQSGSETVLRRMNRHYTKSEYQQSVALIRSLVPEAAITTDIIAGFPGETDREFAESYKFCKQTGFARIHVFPYSARAGTDAAVMPGQVPDKVKQRRTRQLLALAGECSDSFCRQFLGKTMPVLWEQQTADGLWSGLTGNYIKVYTESSEDMNNRIAPAGLTEIRDEGVWGKLL